MPLPPSSSPNKADSSNGNRLQSSFAAVEDRYRCRGWVFARGVFGEVGWLISAACLGTVGTVFESEKPDDEVVIEGGIETRLDHPRHEPSKPLATPAKVPAPAPTVPALKIVKKHHKAASVSTSTSTTATTTNGAGRRASVSVSVSGRRGSVVATGTRRPSVVPPLPTKLGGGEREVAKRVVGVKRPGAGVVPPPVPPVPVGLRSGVGVRGVGRSVSVVGAGSAAKVGERSTTKVGEASVVKVGERSTAKVGERSMAKVEGIKPVPVSKLLRPSASVIGRSVSLGVGERKVVGSGVERKAGVVPADQKVGVERKGGAVGLGERKLARREVETTSGLGGVRSLGLGGRRRAGTVAGGVASTNNSVSTSRMPVPTSGVGVGGVRSLGVGAGRVRKLGS
ncbi:hypothetical protein JAAARDRAFT_439389 [Jaapia argillacea MUCL 33604]|uniref:Uncharacterized protein n=1 Tax=Jaapia argillacea MUCL 33604 TaxID=933084 RepID=A0A067PSG0_9AGAM|nr:hypothetical protein JAAARDRAFT_439389 [Jaapia argillacea MUCL 33604]